MIARGQEGGGKGLNVAILVVILHYVVLQDVTIGRNWEKVHGMYVLFFTTTWESIVIPK